MALYTHGEGDYLVEKLINQSVLRNEHKDNAILMEEMMDSEYGNNYCIGYVIMLTTSNMDICTKAV